MATTLTDENPTSSGMVAASATNIRVTPIHKSTTKGAADATVRHGDSDPRPLGMAASPEYSAKHRKMPAEERRHRWKGGRKHSVTEKVSPFAQTTKGWPVPLAGKRTQLRNVFEYWVRNRNPMKIVPRKFEKENREAEGP